MDERHVIAENIPLKYGEAIIGRADLLDDGSIHARIEWAEISAEIRRFVDVGVLESLSIGVDFSPARNALSTMDEMPEGMVERIKERLKPEIDKMQNNILPPYAENDIAAVSATRDSLYEVEMEAKEDQVQLNVSRAIILVYDYINNELDKVGARRILISDIYVVWFCKTLQNWKALVSTNIKDGMYYEITYDGDNRRTYLDAYQKQDNVVIYDDHHGQHHVMKKIIPDIPAGPDRFA